MPLTPVETETVAQVADALSGFLPARPHPYADPKSSFPGVAALMGLSDYWGGGSKRPAIMALLRGTLEHRRDLFCPLVLEIVQRGVAHRRDDGRPVSRREIQELDELIAHAGFRVPELSEPALLDALPGVEAEPRTEPDDPLGAGLKTLRAAFLRVEASAEPDRGPVFEGFLVDLFGLFGLKSRSSFELASDRIDGSLLLDGSIHLVEARWRQERVNGADLLAFRGKVAGKGARSRGLFISLSGFAPDAQEAFPDRGSGGVTGMTGHDLYSILDGKISLVEAIRLKSRRAAETGRFLITVQELLLGS